MNKKETWNTRIKVFEDSYRVLNIYIGKKLTFESRNVPSFFMYFFFKYLIVFDFFASNEHSSYNYFEYRKQKKNNLKFMFYLSFIVFENKWNRFAYQSKSLCDVCMSNGRRNLLTAR